MDPLGMTAVVPKQIDIVYHELELRVSEAFVVAENFDAEHSVFGDAGATGSLRCVACF